MEFNSDLLEDIAKEKEIPPSQIKTLAEAIAFHESKLVPTAKQLSGGPGRGLFQYEVGKDGSAQTARQRALRAYKRYGKKPPKWLKDLPADFDPAELTPDQQFTLFLGDHRERPNSDFSKLKDMPMDEWWGRYHQTQNDPKKREQFVKDYNYLLNIKKA